MALQLRTVILKQLPQALNEEQAWAFLEAFKLTLPADRPRVVLNCAGVHALDRPVLQLLLCCLEEAMKRNGDVKLSSLSEPARATLEASGIADLFKIFESDAEAIKSFQRLPLFAVPEQPAPTVSLGVDVGDDVSFESAEDAA